jgi:hypothetical protein
MTTEMNPPHPSADQTATVTSASLLDAAGGHGTFLGIANSFVHAVMYCYYFVTATWPEYKQSLWWKKHITQLQMVYTTIIVALLLLLLLLCILPVGRISLSLDSTMRMTVI